MRPTIIIFEKRTPGWDFMGIPRGTSPDIAQRRSTLGGGSVRGGTGYGQRLGQTKTNYGLDHSPLAIFESLGWSWGTTTNGAKSSLPSEELSPAESTSEDPYADAPFIDWAFHWIHPCIGFRMCRSMEYVKAFSALLKVWPRIAAPFSAPNVSAR